MTRALPSSVLFVVTEHASFLDESRVHEYERVREQLDRLAGIPVATNHYERVVLARSEECEIEAIGDTRRRWWGTQFHPEAYSPEYPHGERVLRNFFELAQ